MDAKRESAADLSNLILYNPETGKTRKIRPGFSWLFLLIGPFGFFFRGMVKEGLLWVLGLAVACRLFVIIRCLISNMSVTESGSPWRLSATTTAWKNCWSRDTIWTGPRRLPRRIRLNGVGNI